MNSTSRGIRWQTVSAKHELSSHTGWFVFDASL